MKKEIRNLIGLCLTVCSFLCIQSVQAARVDTLSVKSRTMNKDIQVVYILPEKALADTPCPVLYLLHGYSDNARTWIRKIPSLRQQADEKGIIIVCPDGKTSWYFDSPMNPSVRYETFIASELVAYTDRHFATIAHRKARAITGQSMGGHGAMHLAIRHKDTFGAVGCMSGGVDIRPFPQNWDIKESLGEYEQHPEVWDANTVINLIDRLANGDLAITIDCGKDDFFYKVNQNLHKKLWNNGIAHDFVTRPGGHDWVYWAVSIEHQLLFFDRFFNKGK